MKNKKNLSPFRKYLYMLIALLLAIFLWLIVINTEDPVSSRRISGIPIEFINTEVFTDNNMTYEVEGGVSTATVSVEARRSNLNKITADDFTAVVDCNLINDLNGAATVTVTYVGPQGILEDYRVITDTVRIISESVTSKQLDVIVSPEGMLPDGYSVGDVTATPSVVNVSGPASVLNGIYSVGAIVDVTGAVENIETSVQLHYYDVRGQEITLGDAADDITIVHDGSVIDSVDVVVEILANKTIPVSFNIRGTDNVAPGYIYDGYTAGFDVLSIQGDSDALEQITGIDISSELLDVTGESSEKEVRIDLNAFLPEEVRIDGESTVTVVMHVAELKSTQLTIPAEDVTITGARSGYEYNITEADGITVVLSGVEESVNEANTSNVSISIDVSELDEGIHSVTAVVTAPDKLTAEEIHVGVEVVNNSIDD